MCAVLTFRVRDIIQQKKDFRYAQWCSRVIVHLSFTSLILWSVYVLVQIFFNFDKNRFCSNNPKFLERLCLSVKNNLLSKEKIIFIDFFVTVIAETYIARQNILTHA